MLEGPWCFSTVFGHYEDFREKIKVNCDSRVFVLEYLNESQ